MAEKYQAWQRGEMSLAAAANGNITIVGDIAEDDITVVSALCEVALCTDKATLQTAEQGVISGYVRLYITRANLDGLAEPVAQNGTTFLDPGAAVDTVQDAEAGDTWAWAPFCLGTAQTTRVILMPRTARKLRKGDRINLLVAGTNDGDDTQDLHASGTATFFIQG